MRIRHFLRGCLCLTSVVLALGLLPTARALADDESLYVLFKNGQLATVDPVTVAVSPIGTPVVYHDDFLDITANSHGQIYGTSGVGFFRVDRQTGATTVIASNRLTALAFDRQDVLWGQYAGGLVQVDPATGGWATVGSLPDRYVSFSFDVDGGLFGVKYPYSGAVADLYRIDTITSQETFVGTFGSGCGRTFEIAFDGEGTLWGLENCYGSLRTIDPQSAAILTQSNRIVGADRGYADITFVVPEPATMGVVALGLSAVLIRRRKEKSRAVDYIACCITR